MFDGTHIKSRGPECPKKQAENRWFFKGTVTPRRDRVSSACRDISTGAGRMAVSPRARKFDGPRAAHSLQAVLAGGGLSGLRAVEHAALICSTAPAYYGTMIRPPELSPCQSSMTFFALWAFTRSRPKNPSMDLRRLSIAPQPAARQARQTRTPASSSRTGLSTLLVQHRDKVQPAIKKISERIGIQSKITQETWRFKSQ